MFGEWICGQVLIPFVIFTERKGTAGLFFKFCLTDGSAGGRSGGQGQTSQTELYYGIVHCYRLKCFLLVLKRKWNAHTFFKFSLADGCAKWRAGGQGQTSQTEIYYRIVQFYCFKRFLLVLKSNGHANLFYHFGWQRECSQFLKLCLADGYAGKC